MTTELFSGNILIIYAISVMAIICYSNFEENQRMFLIYLLTYGTVLLKVLTWQKAFLMLGIVSFVFLEYLSGDKRKLEIITRLDYKVCDYLFLMFFQFHLFFFLVAMCFFAIRECTDRVYSNIFMVVSGVAFVTGEHLTITQPFKVKTISSVMSTFDRHPYYLFSYEDNMKSRFDMLCAFEDRTFFRRSKSYSSLSMEYLREGEVKKKAFMCIRKTIRHPKELLKQLKYQLLGRGHSTPEMQLIRTLGVERGYEHRYVRKIYELVYSKIFLSSLYNYYRGNSGKGLTHYREYLLYIYVQSVLTRIGNKRFSPFSSVFEKPKDVANWSMDGLFVACLGLSFRRVSYPMIERYHSIVEEFGLSSGRIMSIDHDVAKGRKIPNVSMAELVH